MSYFDRTIVSCPYNPEHTMRKPRLLWHLAQSCPDIKTKGHLFSICPYNCMHIIKNEDFKEHKENCPDIYHSQHRPGSYDDDDIWTSNFHEMRQEDTWTDLNQDSEKHNDTKGPKTIAKQPSNLSNRQDGWSNGNRVSSTRSWRDWDDDILKQSSSTHDLAPSSSTVQGTTKESHLPQTCSLNKSFTIETQLLSSNKIPPSSTSVFMPSYKLIICIAISIALAIILQSFFH